METKFQWSQWTGRGSRRPKKTRREFLPEGETMNRSFFLGGTSPSARKHPTKKIRFVERKSWIFTTMTLLHIHRYGFVITCVKSGTTVLCSFHSLLIPIRDSHSRNVLFPKLKSTLKGRRFDSIDAIKEDSQRQLRAIPKEVYQTTFQTWKVINLLFDQPS